MSSQQDPNLGTPPNWRVLFGSGSLDLIECQDCHSVYSPAAYFANLLNFLGNNSTPALKELFRRRPDLRNIALSCENTETQLPYIDLVNEVLENAVVNNTYNTPQSSIDEDPVFYWDKIGEGGAGNDDLFNFFEQNFDIQIHFPLPKFKQPQKRWDKDDLTHKAFNFIPYNPITIGRSGTGRISIVRDIQTTRSGPSAQVQVPPTPTAPGTQQTSPQDPLAPSGWTMSPTPTTFVPYSLSWGGWKMPDPSLLNNGQIIGFLIERSTDGSNWDKSWEVMMGSDNALPTWQDNNAIDPTKTYYYRISSIIGFLQTTTARATLDYTIDNDVWDRQTCDFIIIQNSGIPAPSSGKQILTGSGSPPTALGTNGDIYLDVTTGNYYQNISGAWTQENNVPVYPLIQTDGTSAELGANPQHTNVAAYEMLSDWNDNKANFPINLPFNLWVEQARAYMKQLGTSLYEVMSTCRCGGVLIRRSKPSDIISTSGTLTPPTDNDDPTTPTGLTFKSQQLGWNAPKNLSVYFEITGYIIERSENGKDWYVISNAYTGANPPSYNDTKTNPTSSYRISTILADVASACEYLMISPDELQALTDNDTAKSLLSSGSQYAPISVQAFLDRTGIAYTDLVTLIKTNFINPDETVEISIDPTEPNNLSKMFILRLDTINWGLIPRFIRLWKKLGWQMEDLDRVAKALNATDIDHTLVANLACLVQIQSSLQIPLVNVCALFSLIDTQGDDSLYSQIFLNATIKNPPDPAFELDEKQTALLVESSQTPEPLSNHTDVIAAALGITGDDLVTMTNPDPSDSFAVQAMKVNYDSNLTLGNLSKLYRIATLSQALDLSVKDFFVLVELTKINPFDQLWAAMTEDNLGISMQKDVSNIQLFIKKAQEVSQFGFSAEVLNYILRNLYNDADGIRPLEGDVSQFFAGLRAQLQKVRQQAFSTLDPKGDLLKKNLPLVLTPERDPSYEESSNVHDFIEKLFSIINGTSTASDKANKDTVKQLFQLIYDSKESAEAQNFLTSLQPTALKALPVSYNEIDLSWAAPQSVGTSALSGYKIERSADGTNWQTLVPNTNSQATSYTDTSIQPSAKNSVSYYYRVSAIDAAGHLRDSSDIVIATIPANLMPFAPQGLEASLVSLAIVQLGWTAPVTQGGSPSPTGYMIERSTDGGMTWPQLPLVPNTNPTLTTYLDIGVDPSQTYTYRVSAIYSPSSNSSPSNSASPGTVSTPASNPGAAGATPPPTNLTAQTISSMAIDLNWKEPPVGGSSVTGYMIQYQKSTDGGNSWSPWAILIQNTNSTATSYQEYGQDLNPGQIPTLAAGTMYNFSVSAIGPGVPSPPTAGPAATPDPTSPVILSAKSQNTGQTMQLNWKQPSFNNPPYQVIGYVVERQSSPDGTTGSTWQTLPNPTPILTSFTDTLPAAAPAGTSYSYRVTALFSGDPSNPQFDDSGTNFVETPASNTPSSVMQLSASQASQSEIELTWDPPAVNGNFPITGYMIERQISIDDGSTWSDRETLTSNTDSTDTTYADKTVIAGESYRYRITPLMICWNIPPGKIMTGKGTPDSSVGQYNDFYVDTSTGNYYQKTSGAWVQQGSLSLGAGAKIYTASGKPKVAGSNGDLYINADTGDYYQQTSGNWTQLGTLALPGVSAIPNAPTSVSVKPASSTENDLNWVEPTVQSPASNKGYVVERSTDGGLTWSLLATINSQAIIAYNDKNLDPGTSYSYRVGAIVGGTTSDPVSVLPVAPRNIADKFSYVTSRVINYILSTNVIEQALAAYMNLSTEAVDVVLDYFAYDSEGSMDIYRMLLDSEFVASDLPILAIQLNSDNIFDLFYRLHKASLLVNNFKITPSELAYLLNNPLDFANFNLRFYPSDLSGLFSFVQWEALFNVFRLRNGLPGGVDLFAFFGQTYAPLRFNAALAPPSTINLTWSRPIKKDDCLVRGYLIERSNDGGSTWTTVRFIKNIRTSQQYFYPDTGLPQNQSYTYRVATVFEYGTGAASYALPITTPTNTVPVPGKNLVPTKTILKPSPASNLGQKVTFTAQVLPATATGYVTFTINGRAQPPVVLAGGIAVFSTSSLANGDKIIAAYSGDANYSPSSSGQITQTVNALPVTTVSLKSSPVISTVGQPVLFTATVSSSVGNVVTGTVTFTIDGSDQPQVILLDGKATLKISSLAEGIHIVTAYYSGDDKNAGSTSSQITLTVQQADLATVTGWNTTDGVVADFNCSGNFRDWGEIILLKKCLDVSTRIGVSPTLLFSWARKEISSGVAGEIKNALRARYTDEDQWNQVAQQVENPLRDKKEAALVSYLVYNMSVNTCYLDTDTGNYYQKVSGAWNQIGNLKGSNIFNGAGAPGASLGSNKDFYVDTNTGNYYQNQGGTWAQVGNLQIPLNSIQTGSGAPPNPTGSNAIFYLDTSTGNFYQNFLDEEWAPQGNLIQLGSILRGSGPPDPNVGNDNDFYLDTSTSNYYKKICGNWSSQPKGNLQTSTDQGIVAYPGPPASNQVPPLPNVPPTDSNIFWFDTNTGNYYQNIANSWLLEGNLVIPQKLPRILTGSGFPDDSLGGNGQIVVPQVNTPDDLFNFLLIDVQMSSCRTTSRISQAIMSVQLFIQRILMGLEQVSGLTPDSILSTDMWSWMQSYSTWQANRQVFLYPENYLQPSLRKDQTPFFGDFLNEVSQSDITNDTSETAYINYLKELEKVAHLQPCGSYFDIGEGTNILNVVARTPYSPYTYYYREYDGYLDSWTAWEKINAGIDGEPLLPLVFKKRLYIFWPTFTEKSLPIDNNDPNPPINPEKYYEINLAWIEYKNGKCSEHKNGKWTAKQLSSGIGSTLITTQNESQSTSETFYPDKKKLLFIFNGYITNISQEKSDEFYISIFSDDWSANMSTYQVGIETAAILCGYFMFPYSGFVASSFLDPTGKPYYNINLPANTDSSEYNWIRANTTSNWPGAVLQIPIPAAENSLQVKYNPKLLFPVNANEISYTSDEISQGQNQSPNWALDTYFPFFYHDDKRTFVAYVNPLNTQPPAKYRTFYHPFVGNFIRQLAIGGVAGLLSIHNQSTTTTDSKSNNVPGYDFVTEYSPSSSDSNTYAREEIEFTSPYGPYSEYNWELFFHIPFLIATKLSNNQKFEDARNWFHYIFNPTTNSTDPVPQRYWNCKPFYDDAVNSLIINVQNLLGDPANAGTLDKQVQQWQSDPFNPFKIAEIRPGVYEKAVVMAYIDNLIAWGDQLFGQFTSETVNMATEMYVLAREILGQVPPDIPPSGVISIQTWQTLNLFAESSISSWQPLWQDFAEAFVQLENAQSFVPGDSDGSTAPDSGQVSDLLGIIEMPYFCIPQNSNLLGYWQTVDQRLYNIRHCMNIQGVKAQPALFPPPINPMLLVQAAAAGVDITSALSDLDAPVPYYRFTYMIQKAIEACSDVKALGGSLLTALEKRDAEDIAMIRATQEVNLLNKIKLSKQLQIQESNENVDTMNKSLDAANWRYSYYSSRPFMNAGETLHLELITAAWFLQTISQLMHMAGSTSHLIPKFDIGTSGISASPVVKVRFGGDNLGHSLEAFATAMSFFSSFLNLQGTMVSTLAGYQRRMDDWQFQAGLAKIDAARVNAQIAAANTRVSIAQNDLDSHNLQIQNATDIQTWMQNKFTNKELYDWMVSQVSQIYFNSYQMAYEVAKKAEKSYQFETGDITSTFIQFGYWDNLKQGLLAGEKLNHDLKTLEKSYIDRHKRHFEITKDISLALINPKALLDLKEKGSCNFELPELLFDMDFPGHYKRRIKSVSLTIPCVAGPYTSVNCVLTLLSNKVRMSANVSGNASNFYDDSNFASNYSSTQSIATSHGQNDSGMFELNFHDERYLPFEGAGVDSQWLLEIPQENFDFGTISDVIIKVDYTAHDGGSALRSGAQAAYDLRLAKAATSGMMRLFSARHEFPNEWQNFVNPQSGSSSAIFKIKLAKRHFPFQFDFGSIKINTISLFLQIKKNSSFFDSPDSSTIALTLNGTSGNLSFDDTDFMVDNMMHFQMQTKIAPSQELDIAVSLENLPSWLTTQDGTLNSDIIEDMAIICYYTAAPKDMPKYFGG